MKNLICIFIIFNILFCKGQTKTTELNITTTYPKISLRKIPKTWKSLTAIQKEWIKVEKDIDGYLIYEPCVGDTETIKFEHGNININWRIEREKYSYEKFTRITGNNSFRLDAYGIENKKNFKIKATIIDHINGIVLWEFDSVQWLMTPKENYKSFKIVKNNCDTEKKTELEFLPIEK